MGSLSDTLVVVGPFLTFFGSVADKTGLAWALGIFFLILVSVFVWRAVRSIF